MLYIKRSQLKTLLGGWMGGWVDGWVAGKAGLSIAYSNQKLNKLAYSLTLTKYVESRLCSLALLSQKGLICFQIIRLLKILYNNFLEIVF
jgi:hypothetical protein